MNINNELKWCDIDVKGERTGTRYTGRVCIKPFLPHKEARDAQLLAEEYCGNIRSSEMVDFFTVLAYVKFHVTSVESADWYKGSLLDSIDRAPFYEIAKKVSEIQNPKKDEAKDDGKEDKKEG